MRGRGICVLPAALALFASPVSAATIGYTLTGTTLNDAYLFDHTVPSPLPFTIQLYFDSNVSPIVDGRTADILPNDPKDSYTVGGETAFYLGLGGSVQTSIDFDTGLRELRLSGDTIVDYGFFMARSGYQFIVLSDAFTADYTHPGVYTAANATLNKAVGYNTSIIQTFIPEIGYNDARTTYLQLDKLVITNSDFPSVLPSPVPLPASAPMFDAALVAFGAVGYGLKRKKAAG